jgi:hypothetical protein
MDSARAGRQKGDRSAGQQYRTPMRGLREHIGQQQKTLDDGLHGLLTADQQKKLDDWHASMRKSMRARPGR